ncbi:DeoR/GlpR family DNA-binding transcription regulator [Pseudonocardia thermophila]|uniref:DeoR/GlpR family DNA-binding transcription regulator n=1 Tax=Pseudonocardia thermophila TaxID=1848 RepID=UPI0009376C66|nr:DeoR/GlpR family DNA-binding transcription regulator [Pseudonocardia thermophila]
MLPASRHSEILRIVQSSGIVSVETLACGLNVSPSTIRRDLQALEASGALRRVHGGALPCPRPSGDGDHAVGHPAGTVSVADAAAEAKERIARCAAELVQDGDVVLIDIGTTTARLAARLRDRRVTVITSSLAVVDVLRDADDVDLLVLGGVLRRNHLSFVGSLTEQALREVRARWLFLGASGVRPDGTVMDTTLVEVPVKQTMIAAAERTALLADRGKFPGTGVSPVCGPDAVDVLVTDAADGEPSDCLASALAAFRSVRHA